MSKLILKFPGGFKKAFTASYDDGCPNDKRLADLFRKYGIKATFNLVSTWKYDKSVYEGFEVASHGLTHTKVDHINGSNLAMEIIKDRENLEKEFGQIVRGYAYPGGAYSVEAERMLGELGICYARSCGRNEWFELPLNFLKWNPTTHHRNEKLFELVERFNTWKSGYPALFYVWGHSYEFATEEDWEIMEKFLSEIALKDDVWYASNIEVYDYCEAFSRLKYSVDCNIVFNPSAVDVWFESDAKVYCVKAGQTINIGE